MKITEDIIIQYFENELSSDAKSTLEIEVLKDAEANKIFEQYKEFYTSFDSPISQEVPTSLQSNFENFLATQTAKPKQKGNRLKLLVPILIAGLFLIATYFFYANRMQNKEIQKQMFAMNENMQNLMQNESSAYRIKAVKLSAEMPVANTTAIKLLMDALANDRSSNVRLSALEALEQHINNDEVRASIYKSMSTELDPIVLLTYVNILTNSKEESSPEVLRDMTENEAIDQFIKDEAHLGLFKLEQY